MNKNIWSLICIPLFLLACRNSPEDLLDVGVPRDMAAYRKAQVSEVVYGLSLDIPAEKDSAIPAKLVLDLEIHDLSRPLYLDFNADGSLLKQLSVNGKPQEVVHKKEHLIVSEGLHLGKNRLEIQFVAGERSLNRNGDYLYSLLVPERASTFFPCFDQPDIKGGYLLDVGVPHDWKVLSGAILESKTMEGDRAHHRFALSDPMSSYLFSVVAGKFESRTENPGIFDMTFLYRETDSAKIGPSIPMIYDLHQRSIDFLKGYTEYEFPFQKLDFAAIPGFQYGGMEHVGAIQYRQSTLFLDESATERRRMGRAKLIAHETAHMWFGDLVTMEWFDDVWMKEVFANFMADKIINPTFPGFNHSLQFMTSHYPSAYGEDRSRGSNPIRQPLENLKNAGSLYGGIIYNKAPIMMRQLEARLGETAFRNGVREYISKFAYDNAGWGDLVGILDRNSEEDLESWSRVWANESGRPIFTEEIEYKDGSIKNLALVQKAEDGSDKLWPQSFEISLIYSDSVKTLPVSISGKSVEISAAKGLQRPRAIIYNSNALGYGLFPIEPSDLPIIHGLKDEVGRGYAYLNAFENVLQGTLGAGEGLAFFVEGIQREGNELIHGLLCNQANMVFWNYLDEETRAVQQPLLEDLLWEELRSSKHSPNIKKNLFRLWKEMAYSKRGMDRLYVIWKGDLSLPGLKLNADDHTQMAMDLALYGHGDADEILDSARAALTNEDQRERFDFIRPSLSGEVAVRNNFFNSLKEVGMREKESWVLTAAGHIHHPLRQDSSRELLPLALELLEEIQRTGDIFFPKRWLVATIGQYQSPGALEQVEIYLGNHPDLNPSLRGKLLQATDDLYRFVGMRKNLEPMD